MIRSSFAKLGLGLFISTLPLTAATQKAPNYDAALAQATKAKQPFAVLIHGKSWHNASQAFLDKLWYSDELSKSTTDTLIITDIHIEQNLTKEQTAEAENDRKSWKNTRVSSFPAIQYYDSAGSLVKTYQGRELRKISSVSALTSHLNGLTDALKKRDTINQQIAKARQDKNTQLEAELLGEIIQLPLSFDKKSLVDQLKAADPEDHSGWQAQLNFNNWNYMRHITGLINGKKIDQALQETEDALKKEGHTPEQRCMILGAKGKALAARGEYVKAWDSFKLAKEADPEGPTGNAILNYGVRVAMLPSRSGFPRNSPLFGKDLGENLTRDHASFSMSSSASDNPEHHTSLFTGSFSPSGYAFHTDVEKNAHIIIDLQAVCTIKALHIMNRTGNGLEQRAATLELYISSDQKNWTKVWSAEQAQPEWDILLDKTATARYLKLSLNSPNPQNLHLKAVSAFGERK